MAEMGAYVCKLLFLIMLSSGASSAAAGVSKDPDDVAKWLHETQSADQQKLTNLHFFFHDTVSGNKNPTTTVTIAKSAISDTSRSAFGELNMAEDPLTLGPSLNSTTIGYARGLYGLDGRNQTELAMAMSLVFTAGEHSGSTLSLVGRNAASESPREIPIMGGTGAFRLAGGVAIARDYFVSATAIDGIIEYHVSILHY